MLTVKGRDRRLFSVLRRETVIDFRQQGPHPMAIREAYHQVQTRLTLAPKEVSFSSIRS
jgi:hypothetical protein